MRARFVDPSTRIGTMRGLIALLAIAVMDAASSPQSGTVEVALVANAEAGTVAVFDVATRTVIGSIDVNPQKVASTGPGARNYAQDTDVSPDGRTLYVSRGYLGDVAAFDIATGRLL